MAAPSLEAALESDTECTSESCAVNALQVDSTKTQDSLSAGDGAVHCLCKDREDKYYCSKSFAGFSKCYGPCPSLCTETGGKFYMCGGKHENLWLDRFFKNQEEPSMKCKLDPKDEQ
ncbi:unnamed protein product [Durusdinium trenchii]|uniref:Uncharacterized protein n=1 Tax=Durusdinium trenchii TaxID=1381693 RepID=A0ABP0L349_9DINO